MALIRKEGATGVDGIRSSVEIQKTDGTWLKFRGISDSNYDAGERSSQTRTAYNGSFSILGGENFGDVQFTFVSWLPNDPAVVEAQAAKTANEDRLFRVMTPPATTIVPIISGRTGAIDTSGVFTVVAPAAAATPPAARAAVDTYFAGRAVQELMVVKVTGDDRWRTIDEIQVDGEKVNGQPARWSMNVLPTPSTAVTAGTFAIQKPRFDFTFVAGVKALGGWDLPSDGALNSTMTLTPNQALDLPELANA